MIALLLPEFAEPGRLTALLLIPLLGVGYLVLHLRRRAGRGSDAAELGMVQRDRAWLRHLVVGLALLSLATLTMAWAKPQGDVLVPRQRATVVIAMDVSYSMQADDVKPTRLAAAKLAARKFVTDMPATYNVALVKFARNASLVVPPTQDHHQVTDAIDGLELAPATAIGEGIYTSLDALNLLPPAADTNEPVPARIVLLSDGKNTVGRSAFDAAAEARARQTPVDTIAYGTQTGIAVINGEKVAVPVDELELRDIAVAGGGKAYAAKSAGQLQEVYRDIGNSLGYMQKKEEVSAQYAGFGLVCAVLACLGIGSLAARWP